MAKTAWLGCVLWITDCIHEVRLMVMAVAARHVLGITRRFYRWGIFGRSEVRVGLSCVDALHRRILRGLRERRGRRVKGKSMGTIRDDHT